MWVFEAFRPRKKKKQRDKNDGDARIRILLPIFFLLRNTTPRLPDMVSGFSLE